MNIFEHIPEAHLTVLEDSTSSRPSVAAAILWPRRWLRPPLDRLRRLYRAARPPLHYRMCLR